MREVYILIAVFLFLSFGMHFNEFISFPFEHIKNLQNAGAYGLGSFHPLFFTFIVYLILWIPRGIYKLIKK